MFTSVRQFQKFLLVTYSFGTYRMPLTDSFRMPHIALADRQFQIFLDKYSPLGLAHITCPGVFPTQPDASNIVSDGNGPVHLNTFIDTSSHNFEILNFAKNLCAAIFIFSINLGNTGTKHLWRSISLNWIQWLS